MDQIDGRYPRNPTRLSEEERQALKPTYAQLPLLFDTILEEKHAPGLAIGIVVNGELDHSFVTGKRDIRSGTPVETETVFRIASMTKSFTALAILQLRDAGLLSLDDPVRSYVPELSALAYPNRDSPELTPRHLLSMQSGLPQDDPWADRQLYQHDDWLSDLLSSDLAFSNPPGTTFEYSNLGYKILGRVVANVSGRRTMDYITEELLHPLGMDKTVWNPGDADPKQLASGYVWLDDTHHEVEQLNCNNDGVAFAGLLTTLRDLSQWVGLFQSSWWIDESKSADILRPSSLREMQQIAAAERPSTAPIELGRPTLSKSGGYGFGLAISNRGARRSIGHGGGLPGFGSHMRWSPDASIGVIAFANVTYAGVGACTATALDALCDTLIERPRSLPATPALERARTGVNQLLTGWDDQLADELFADNFFLDLDREHWKQRFAELHEHHGKLTPSEECCAENWLRGEWHVAGEQGWCTVWLSLTPTSPPRIQELRIKSIVPPSQEQLTVCREVVQQVSTLDQRLLEPLLSEKCDQPQLWRRIRLAHLYLEGCSIGQQIGGDGHSWVQMKLRGGDSEASLKIHTSEQGKIDDLLFTVHPA